MGMQIGIEDIENLFVIMLLRISFEKYTYDNFFIPFYLESTRQIPI
jgi:hypothetical protein